MEMPVCESKVHQEPSMMLDKVADLYPTGTSIHNIQSPTFDSLRSGHPMHRYDRCVQHSLSPMGAPTLRMQQNPFIESNSGIIPGPMSLNCDSTQFINSWIKYILQSAICVTTHTLTFFITMIWFRFLFSSYFEYLYHSRIDIAHHTTSILSHLPGSPWIWLAICMTDIVFLLGFMIQFWITPIQWNFEDNSNTKLFRYFGISFVILTVSTKITFSIFQICGFPQFHEISTVSQLVVVSLFSFLLLFVIIKNSRSSNSLNANHSNSKINCNHNEVADPLQSGSDIDLGPDLSPDPVMDEMNRVIVPELLEIHEIEIVKRQHFRIHRMIDFEDTKLLMICTVFSCIITMTMLLFYVTFHFMLPLILSHNISKERVFDQNFTFHLVLILLGVLLMGNLLILGMRVLTRWLTILMTDSSSSGNGRRKGQSKASIPRSFNAHYGSMQSLNRMILFTIPMMFIVKLMVFVMLYTFVDSIEFGVAVIAFCVFSRCLNQILNFAENKMVEFLMKSHDAEYFEDDHSLMHLQDHHLLAQCNYIHDIIHYIVTLTVPVMFAVFGVHFANNKETDFSKLHYMKLAVMQFLIHSMFDLFPLLIILCGNPHQLKNGRFHQLSHRLPFVSDHEEVGRGQNCCSLSRWAMSLKAEYINMMNGWTATDRCVRHFVWWCTIFIGGYFAFFLLYPQQFLCAVRRHHATFMIDDWIYVQCQ